MRVKQFDAPFGVEVLGIDVANDVTDQVMGQLTSLLYQHRLLVLRAQHLSPKEYLEFGRRWGRAHPHVLDHARMKGFPEILPIGNVTERAREDAVRNGAVQWHTDQSYEQEPASATMLYSIKAPHEGGETQLTDQVAAYNELNSDMKGKISDLMVLHQYGAGRVGDDEYPASPIKTQKQKDRLPVVRHPLVRRHPVTGHAALYGVSGTSFGIEGMDEVEGVALLSALKEHALEEQFIYRHKYSVGDIALWDTLSTMHSATPIHFASGETDSRLLYRISVKGLPYIHHSNLQ